MTDASEVGRAPLGRDVFDSDQAPEDERREVRLCLIMTGGVSLAVWMGGVTAEIYRASRAVEGDPLAQIYREVLDETWSRVVVDVVSGTSAGGLNGALLGAATTAGLDVETFLDLRNTWLEMGSFGQLMRDPSTRDPASILQGDTYFLPQLRSLFDSWLPPGRPLGPDLEMMLTGTLLTGTIDRHVDSFGTALVEAEYRTQFHFDSHDLADDLAPARLALAARSSASFPGAFEASFISIEPGPDHLHPEMGSVTHLDTNRYVVDGGVLMNQPIGPALDAVFRRAASRDVRRVLLYVNPDPADPEPLPAPTRAPALLEVLRRTTLVVPQKQTIGVELAEIELHNRTADLQRRARAALLGGSVVESLAAELWPAFIERRSIDAVRGTTDRVASAVRYTDLASVIPGAEWHDIERTLGTALADTAVSGSWLGESFPSVDELPPHRRAWIYGIAPIEYSISALLDLLRQLQEAVSVGSFAVDRRDRIRNLRALLHDLRIGVEGLRDVSEAYWAHRIEAAGGLVELVAGAVLHDPETASREFSAGLAHWAKAAHLRWPTLENPDDRYAMASFRAVGAPIATSEAMHEALADTAASIAAVAGAVSRLVIELDASGVVIEGATDIATGLAPEFRWILEGAADGATPDAAAILRRLLAVHVVQTALHGPPDAREQPVELVQISANQRHRVDPTRHNADSKLAGVQLAHFGAFAKASWRANDWLWGRLDGAARILRVLVEPSRIRRLAEARCANDPTADGTQLAVEVIRRLAVGPDDVDGAAERAARFETIHRSKVELELAWINRGSPTPRSLPYSAAAIAERAHELILQEELPILAWAVLKSAKDGAALGPKARDFAETVAARMKRSGRLRAAETSSLLTMADIASETMADERWSLAFLELITGSFAVTTSALAGRRGGLGSIGTLLVPAKYATLAVERSTRAVNQLRRRYWADLSLQGVPDRPPHIPRER